MTVDATDASGNPTPTFKETITGVVNSGTSSLVTCLRGLDGTTAQVHSTGANVVQWFTANDWNDFITSYLTGHVQAGHHQALNDVNGHTWIGQTATSNAVNYLSIANSTSGSAVVVSVAGTDSNISVSHQAKGTGTIQLLDGSSNELLKTATTSAAVNEVTITNASTGNGPSLGATGGDTNIDLNLVPKGTGRVVTNGAGVLVTTMVTTSETTGSSGYADLATTTDTVTATVGASGIVKVTVGATFNNNGANQTYVDFACSGANTRSATDVTALEQGATSTNFGISKMTVLTGLTPGSTVFKMKYRVTGGTGTFFNRSITVEPVG